MINRRLLSYIFFGMTSFFAFIYGLRFFIDNLSLVPIIIALAPYIISLLFVALLVVAFLFYFFLLIRRHYRR